MTRSTTWIGVAAVALTLAATACSSDDGSAAPDTPPVATAAPAPDPAPAASDSPTSGAAATEAPATTPAPPETMPSGPLTFAFPPGTDDPEAIAQVATIAELISESLGREVRTENPADYMAVVEAVRAGFVDVALMSPFSTALAIRTNAVRPLVAWQAEQLPASICFVRADSDIWTLDDLRGRQVAFVDPGSTTGHFMPRAMLAEAGLTMDTDYRATFAGGHDTAILALVNGSVDLACTARQLVSIFEEAGLFRADQLRQLAETDPIPVGLSVVTRVDLDEPTRQALASTLPDALMSDPDLAALLGGSTEYVVDPGPEVYEPLVAVAESVGLDLRNLR